MCNCITMHGSKTNEWIVKCVGLLLPWLWKKEVGLLLNENPQIVNTHICWINDSFAHCELNTSLNWANNSVNGHWAINYTYALIIEYVPI